MTLHALFMQPSSSDPAIDYSGQEFRQFVRSQLTQASGIGGEQGVLTAANLTVTQRGAGANMSVDVASGFAYIVGDDTTNQGTYFAWSDAVTNVTGWTVPGSGTFHHRLELQVQDKLNNGAYTGYTANFVAKLDNGVTGLPAEDPSAITLATIDIPSGSGSITNSMINDYRQRIGPVAAVKTAATGRTTTTMSDDPDLQLLNLQASAQYALTGNLFYHGGTGAAEGDMQQQWRVPSGTALTYSAVRINASGAVVAGLNFVATDVPTSQTQGTSQGMAVTILGCIATGAAPAYAVLQWGQNSASSTATTMEARSWLRAARIG